VPSSVSDVLAAAGLSPDGGVRWGDRVPEMGPGVYVVALTGDPQASGPTLETCPISVDAVEVLLQTRPEQNLAGSGFEVPHDPQVRTDRSVAQSGGHRKSGGVVRFPEGLPAYDSSSTPEVSDDSTSL
jgi:hypothetical protein